MICKYRVVLAIDGGGIRGIIPLKILAHLQDFFNKIDSKIDIPSCVDVFSSTSASTIFTGALMLQNDNRQAIHHPTEILEFYMKRGKQIFTSNLGLDEKNSIYPLSFVLNHFFGGVKLQDLKKHFLFVSHNRSAQSAFTFTDTMDMYRTLPLSKVMSACAAFPGFFPSFNLGSMELEDGMMAVQNPAQMAYDYARLFYPDDPIVVISLGTGIHPLETRDAFEIQAEEIHNTMKTKAITDSKLIYFRFQPTLQNKLDYTFNAEDLVSIELLNAAENYISSQQNEFEKLLKLIEIKANS